MSLIIVNLCFATVALAVGFIAGACLVGRRSQGETSSPAEEPTHSSQNEEQQRSIEQASMASSRLRDLAQAMASDVGAHTHRVEEITADLQSIDLTDADAMSDGVLKAIEGIISANSELQERLDKAEQQVEAQAELIRTHESEARTDSLTNLSNRRAFDHELGRRFSEWKRNKTPFSLLILDIDHFKKFNDTHGHQAGDEVLRAVGKELEKACRDMDLPCRYGGEEFAIVMPATSAPDGRNLAERVRSMIEDMNVEFEGKQLQVTCSLGLAESISNDSTEAILRRADEALYASKDAGRNCGHRHSGDEILPLNGVQLEAENGAKNLEPISLKFLDQVANRTRFLDDVRRRVAESARSGAPLSVVAVAVDGLKEAMELHGDGSDAILLDAVAEYLLSELREMDFVGRSTDDCFVVMLPQSTLEDANAIVDRSLLALNGCELPIGDEMHRLAVRIGAVELGPADSAAKLLERLERGLQRQELKAALRG